MATDAAIIAAINAATALAISPAQMVALIDRAIASPLTDDGRIVVATSSRGTSITFASIAEAIAARKYYQDQAIAAAGIVGAPGSFVVG